MHEKKILALIFITALALRLNAVTHLPQRYQAVGTDGQEYDQLAMNILHGKGMVMDTNAGKAFIVDAGSQKPTTWRVPVYPLFLALIYWIFGHNILAVRLIQCGIGAFLCILIFYLGRLVFNRKVGLLAAAVMALYQPFIFFVYWGGPGFLFSENLFVFLLAVWVIFLVRDFFQAFSFKNSILAGIIMGVLTLVRPAIVLFPVFIFLILLCKNGKKPFDALFLAFKKMLPFAVGVILVVAPWTVRNYFVSGAFVPLSTEGGFAMFSGNNPAANGSGIIKLDTFLTDPEKAGLTGMSEVERDHLYRRHALDFMSKNLKKMPRLWLKKFFCLWDVYVTDYETDQTTRRIYNIWYSLVFTFALFGMIKTLKSGLNTKTALLVSLFLYFSALAMAIAGDPRFRSPLEPYLVIFAAAGVFAMYDFFRSRVKASLAIGFLVGLNLLLYAYSGLILERVRILLKGYL